MWSLHFEISRGYDGELIFPRQIIIRPYYVLYLFCHYEAWFVMDFSESAPFWGPEQSKEVFRSRNRIYFLFPESGMNQTFSVLKKFRKYSFLIKIEEIDG